MELYQLPTTCGVFVFMGIGVNQGRQDGPAAVVGLGADHDPIAAAQAALIEVCQVRPALRIRLHLPETKERLARLLADHREVTELEDHDLLYAHPSMLDSFDFLRAAPDGSFDWAAPMEATAHEKLETLTAALAQEGTDILYTNLTTEDIALFGAQVARVVIPDYQPMHFGLGERRLAAKRLYELPETFGLEPKSSAQTLNPLPHPLA